MKDILFVDGQPVDLPDDFAFALTLSRVKVGDITIRNVTHTNSVDLLWTPINSRTFGQAWNDQSASGQLNRRLPAKLIRNGFEIIPDGYCWILGSDRKKFRIAIFENVINVFDSISDQKISQLNHIAPSAWTQAGIDAARLNAPGSGVIAAVMNWGFPGPIYDPDFFLPCFFYSDIVQAILKRTGLTLSGSILTDARFTDLVVPYGNSKWEYPLSFGSPYEFKATFDGLANQTINMVPGVSNYYRVDLNADTPASAGYQGSASIFDLASNQATVPDVGIPGQWLSANISGQIYLTVDNWNPGDSFRVRVRIDDAAGNIVTSDFTVIDYATHGASPTGLITVATPVLPYVLPAGYKISLEVGRATSALPTVDITINASASGFTFLKLEFPTTPSRTSVVWNALLPEVGMSEVLKDFLIRFAIVFKQVGTTLSLKTLQEIISDTGSAIDWSGKRVDTPQEGTSFQSTYAQRNKMGHNNLASEVDLGAGFIEVANDTLIKEKTIFTSVFGNCLSPINSGGRKALVPVYDSTSTGIETFADEPGLRICTLRAKDSGEGAITFDAVARSDYKVAYFTDVTRAKDTGFQYFIDQFYSLFAIGLNKRAGAVTRYYRLSESDVYNYDPHRMVFDSGSYFIVDKIHSYIPGKITKVDLFKV